MVVHPRFLLSEMVMQLAPLTCRARRMNEVKIYVQYCKMRPSRLRDASLQCLLVYSLKLCEAIYKKSAYMMSKNAAQ